MQDLAAAQGLGDWHTEAALIRKLAVRKPKALLHKFLDRLAFGMSDCWYWNGSIDNLGYGRFGSAEAETGEIKTHRISWVLFNGRPIPAGKMVLHSCDIRNCVNPEHLSLGDQLENMGDMVRRGRHKVTPMFGEDNPQAKLTNEKVRAIREDRAKGMSHSALANKYGVAQMTINRAVNGKTWRNT
jgi:hypothetical protein